MQPFGLNLAMITINYANPLISYAGRWVDFGDSKGSYWQGSQIRLKVSGTTQVTVSAKYSTSNISFCVLNEDDGPRNLLYFSAAPGTGTASVSFPLTSTAEHEIILKLVNPPEEQWTGSDYTRLISIGVDDGAAVTTWGNNAPIRIGVVGDSWMGAENDWPRLMNSAQFSIYPTSYGGATAAALNARYNYDGNGILNAVEPALDAVLINASVNDLTAGVSGASFESSLSALVDKVQAKHPGVPVFLLQSPRNVGVGINYDSYGVNMQNIASAKTGVTFLPITSTQWNSYVWADAYHLALPSLQELADYVGGLLVSALGPPVTPDLWKELLIQTPDGPIRLNTYSADPSSENTLLMRVSDGYLKLQLNPVPYSTTGKILFRTQHGIFAIN